MRARMMRRIGESQARIDQAMRSERAMHDASRADWQGIALMVSGGLMAGGIAVALLLSKALLCRPPI